MPSCPLARHSLQMILYGLKGILHNTSSPIDLADFSPGTLQASFKRVIMILDALSRLLASRWVSTK